MNPPDILALTADHPDELMDDGVTLLTEGVRSQALFILVDGELEVQRRGRAVVQISEVGAIVGELGFLLESPASADVVTVGVATVRRIDNPARLFRFVTRFRTLPGDDAGTPTVASVDLPQRHPRAVRRQGRGARAGSQGA